MVNSSKSAKAFKPSLTKLRAVMKEVTFNPRAEGTMKITSEVGNRDYYLHAATVEIQEALEGGAKKSLNIIRAIRLLILAEVWRRK